MSEPIGDRPHDVLAAEEFVVPGGDPALRHEEPHDVLAAEEFGVPTGDPSLARGPLALPDEPYPALEPHDVLAAEEFAMPAGHPVATAADPTPRSPARARVLAAAAVTGAVALVVRRRRRLP